MLLGASALRQQQAGKQHEACCNTQVPIKHLANSLELR
jgi:hypothetical protein